MKVVLAGNYEQYVHWCQDNHADPNYGQLYIPSNLNDATQRLQGLRIESRSDVVVVGTFWDNSGSGAVMAEVRSRIVA